VDSQDIGALWAARVVEGVEVHLETQMHERREQIVRDLLLLAPTPLQLDLGLLLHLQLEAEELL
jgi:hypothetical protein